MSSRVSPRAVGAVVVVLFVGSLAVAYTAQRRIPLRTYTYVDAAFQDVGPALRPGNDVRVNGVRVGQVHTITYRDSKAVVDMQLEGDRKVYRDATAYVAARSSLGQKFVQLSPGTPAAGRLAKGQTLDMGSKGDATDLDALVSIFDKGTRTAAASAVRPTGHGLAGHAQDLNAVLGAAPSVLDDAGTVSGALSDPQADLPLMLQTARSISDRFQGRTQQLGQLVDDSATTLDAFDTQDGAPIAQGIKQAPAALADARQALDALDTPLADLQGAATTALPGAKALGDATPDLRGLLRESVTPLDAVPGVSRQAVPAVGALGRLMTDARPLAPKVSRAFVLGQTPLQVLSPYSPEVTLWFRYFTNALRNSDADGHYLRFNVLLNSESFTSAGGLGQLGLPSATNVRNPYPKPGVAQTQHTGGGK